MNKSVIIIGASGHGKVIADIIMKSGDIVVGYLDDNIKCGRIVGKFPVLGEISDYKKYLCHSFVIGIGDCRLRTALAKKLAGVSWYTAIHPTAVISDINVKVGEGTVVMANTVLSVDTSIGMHCIINTGAIVEHDSKIQDYVHISVGVKVAGNVAIGNTTCVGIGAVVINNISICPNCMIGAGAVIIKDINEEGTYVGVPAKKINRKFE